MEVAISGDNGNIHAPGDVTDALVMERFSCDQYCAIRPSMGSRVPKSDGDRRTGILHFRSVQTNPRPMTTPLERLADDRVTPRREFIGQIAASAIVLAGAACASPAATAESAPTPAAAPPAGRTQQPATPPAPVHWDDSWFGKLTAKHKAIFDSPEIEEGLVMAHATGYIRGMRDALAAGPDDVQVVVVIRHAAIPMIFNDAMWAKYDIGAERKIKEGSSEKWATKNQFIGSAPSAPASGAADRPQGTFTWLGSHGHILLGCDLATRNVAGVFARKAKLDRNVVYEDLKANLVPGMILQPSGVYAAHRAQEAGCTYIRST